MPECCCKKRYSGIKKPRNKLFRGIGWGIGIRTPTNRVRASQSFFKTAYLSHFSDFASLKNLSEFYFCSARQIRMRNCEPYTEVPFEAQSLLICFLFRNQRFIFYDNADSINSTILLYLEFSNL